jgi:hypothetical protein
MTKCLLPILSLALFACGSEAPDADEELGSQESEVINGSPPSSSSSYVPPVVAVYHGGPRPCSGTQVNGSGWVLTAAHCVTADKSNDGQLEPVTNFFAAPPRTESPGLQPPGTAVAATRIERPGGLDLALILFPGLFDTSFTSYNGKSVGFYFGAPEDYNNVEWFAQAWGYGRSVFGEPTGEVEDGTTGAGTLRWGWVKVSGSGHLFNLHSGSGNQITWRGDSGGPLTKNSSIRVGVYAPVLLAVNRTSNGSNTADDTAVSAAVSFFHQHLGWFYMKSLSRWDGDAGYVQAKGNPAEPKALVGMSSFIGASATARAAMHWKYDPTTKELRNERGLCLDVQYNHQDEGTPVWMWTCNQTDAQKWSFNKYHQVVNVGGKCLAVDATAAGTLAKIETCSPSDSLQKWTFGAAP